MQAFRMARHKMLFSSPLEQYLSRLSHPETTRQILTRVDHRWQSYCKGLEQPPQPIQLSDTEVEPELDVVICGGTLGILLATGLQAQGWRVALLEAGLLQGREQEWNLSREELETLVQLELLTPDEREQVITSEYSRGRIAFLGGPDHWATGVLNIGIYPVTLLELLKNKFLTLGGKLLENTGFASAVLSPHHACVSTQNGLTLNTRLLIDAMGHFSPIVAQARQGQTPSLICAVVGSCATGFPDNDKGDLLVTTTPIRQQMQYFWEAFPARAGGRTTYLFTYLDLDPGRGSLQAFFEDYATLLPEYQQCELAALQPLRLLAGLFPAYPDSPLRLPWGRTLAVGDAAAQQSPLSFGGFGAMVRHLPRLLRGIQAALAADCLDRLSLAELQPYAPNISVTWLFARTMQVPWRSSLPPDRINQLLNQVFTVLDQLGPEAMQTFLQDKPRWDSLTQTLIATLLQAPDLTLASVTQVGLPTLAQWLSHYLRLGVSSLRLKMAPVPDWTQPQASKAYFRELARYDALRYGTGLE
ncbi:NAD(P)/FAD-dependent oxidoreductase [Leptolyngbya sp. FACHB-261]|uniref:NAD(P)/FAD-dependent oxidoreductase n=1 Tax=Leptolyngbya sp. FACHB-261 TaxID=2692806 RepID=UPI0016898970|nr:FAD-binding oxidoreductase [Leptolyngbya sp. FACHB-261]MBD2100105.1 FAD-binding oxidoreductase [Leptolyngbya sp. FACHB-261]